ncbi:hypothetical protein Hanom_Chr12g01149121 [Helianthus anomalus]
MSLTVSVGVNINSERIELLMEEAAELRRQAARDAHTDSPDCKGATMKITWSL